MIRQFELVERVKTYDKYADEDALNKAYVFAMKAHGNQKRASGDPYFSHPLEVAGILTEYKLDSKSIVTALLHDTIEDTEVSIDDIRSNFDEETAQLVDGVTKLTRIELQSEQSGQAENFRKLVLAMSEDIRVLLVKLADRLHNMRTLQYIKRPEKRRAIAMETMEIYAPLAERIGMQEMKSELEELAFGELNPEARDSILARLKFLRDQGKDNVAFIVEELKQKLTENGLSADIFGREKTPYSIWRKMQKKNISFEQIADIIAFRVLVDNAEDCYRALGVFHRAYHVVPGRFRDYISTPKSNGYQCIHTGVIGPERHRIEIQIRTREMHQVAELGVAAHWQYKTSLDKQSGKDYRWLRELLDILEHAANPDDFLEHTKLEMFSDQVFCFTPTGDVIALPSHATPVDFAYAVHSEIGDTCVGAKVNGRSVPLRTELANGDQVEIITSKAQTPSPTWENFIVTGKARARIRRFVRQRERQEYRNLGRAILERVFRDEQYELTDKALKEALPVLAIATVDDLFADVGAGQFTGRQVLEAVYPGTKKDKRRNGKVVEFARSLARRKPAKKEEKPGIPIKGLIPGMALHFGACCSPLPGDRIVGIVTKGRGVMVHAIDCETLEEYADTPERWIDLAWDESAVEDVHTGRLGVTVTNEPGSLGELSTLIARNEGNISNLKVTNRSPEFFDLMIDVQVRDVRHLTEIIAALRASSVINSVERARG